MPRKPPKLSVEDLQTIIDGHCGNVPRLIEWAKDEMERRRVAGLQGGRPKGSKSTEYKDERVIVPIDET